MYTHTPTYLYDNIHSAGVPIPSTIHSPRLALREILLSHLKFLVVAKVIVICVPNERGSLQ